MSVIRSLRVALFTGNYNYTRDGATQALTRLVDHLREVEGARVRIYAPTAPDTPVTADLVAIPSISLPGRPEYRLALGLPPAARQDLLAFAPDIVHLSTPDLLGFQAQKLARQDGTPVVASLHTRFETYLAYYGLGWLEPVVEQSLLSFYQRCDYVLAPTAAMAATLADQGIRPDRARVWGRGVDRALFDPARRDLDWRRAQGFADDDVVVLFFGRVVLEKGLALFADAFDRLRATHPRAKALVVGEGPARPWLMQRLPDAVFTGFLAGADLARAVAGADVLLNPSTTEAFGNVNLEAMASGLAVVCADLPSSHALLSQGVTGLLCAPANAETYAAAVGRLLDRPGVRAALGRAARDASARHDWHAELSSVAVAYRDALAVQAAERLQLQPAA